jgi:hypothetical protein
LETKGGLKKLNIIVLVQGFPYNVVLALKCKGTTFLFEEKTQGKINIKEVGAERPQPLFIENHFVN